MRGVFAALLLPFVALAVIQTQHFIIDDSVPYASQVATWLEQAYSLYTSKGLTPMPPCSGTQYPVYGISGTTAYTYAGSCVVKIELPNGVTDTTLMRLVYHELGHVFMYGCVSPGINAWYMEAIPEAMAAVSTGNYYFPLKFYSDYAYWLNPYSQPLSMWYDWSAVYVNLLASSSNWQSIVCRPSDQDLVNYLLKIAKGDNIGGTSVAPSYDTENYAGVNLVITGTLNPLTANYVKLGIWSGCVLLQTQGNVVSNIALNTWFPISNNTLYIAIVNPSSTSSTSFTITVQYQPACPGTTTTTTIPKTITDTPTPTQTATAAVPLTFPQPTGTQSGSFKVDIQSQVLKVDMTFASTALAQMGIGVYVVPVNSTAFNVTIYTRPAPPLVVSQLTVNIAVGVINSTGSYILLTLGTASISNPSNVAFTYTFRGSFAKYNAVFYQVTAVTNQGTYVLPASGEWFAAPLMLPPAQLPPTFSQYLPLLAMAPVLALGVRMGLRAQALGLAAYAAVIMPLFTMAGVTTLRAAIFASIALAIAIFNFLAARKVEG